MKGQVQWLGAGIVGQRPEGLSSALCLEKMSNSYQFTVCFPISFTENKLVSYSQFEDIYEEEHFMETLKDEVNIVKDLPSHLKLLDLETAGSIVSDSFALISWCQRTKRLIEL